MHPYITLNLIIIIVIIFSSLPIYDINNSADFKDIFGTQMSNFDFVTLSYHEVFIKDKMLYHVHDSFGHILSRDMRI